MTKGEFISSILNGIKANTKDTNISRRLVLSVAESYAKTYMAQRLDSLRIGLDTSLVKEVRCFPMEKENVKRCGHIEFKTCENLMKSKYKIPDTIESRTGYGVFLVTSIDGEKEYDYITKYEYSRRKKRKHVRQNKKFYTIQDGYLYLLDSTIKMVDLYMIVLNEEELEGKSTCAEYKDTADSLKCKSLWEETFVCPEKLLTNVRTATLQEIGSMVSIPTDENPNLDSNEKTATVNKV